MKAKKEALLVVVGIRPVLVPSAVAGLEATLLVLDVVGWRMRMGCGGSGDGREPLLELGDVRLFRIVRSGGIPLASWWWWWWLLRVLRVLVLVLLLLALILGLLVAVLMLVLVLVLVLRLSLSLSLSARDDLLWLWGGPLRDGVLEMG